MSVVIDSSLTVAWYFPDAGTDATDDLLRQVAASGAVVPGHWQVEVANAFLMAVRRKRIDTSYRDSSLGELSRLDVTTDPETNVHVWAATVQLADRHGLTIYDAIYLELALRRRLPLATLDQALRRAGQAAGLTLLGMTV